jgi:hypothetical protein
MRRCLNREEFEELIKLKIEGRTGHGNSTVRVMLDNAENWVEKIVGMNYLLSKVLERRIGKRQRNCKDLIDLIYNLPEVIWFDIQEHDQAFIEYMLYYEPNLSLSLEEKLIEVQDNLDAYNYGPTFRR